MGRERRQVSTWHRGTSCDSLVKGQDNPLDNRDCMLTVSRKNQTENMRWYYPLFVCGFFFCRRKGQSELPASDSGNTSIAKNQNENVLCAERLFPFVFCAPGSGTSCIVKKLFLVFRFRIALAPQRDFNSHTKKRLLFIGQLLGDSVVQRSPRGLMP